MVHYIFYSTLLRCCTWRAALTPPHESHRTRVCALSLYTHVYLEKEMSSATAQKRAAFSILRFLNESLQNGTIKADDAEGIEVASESLTPVQAAGEPD